MNLIGALEGVANRRSGHGIKAFRGDRMVEQVDFGQLYAEAGQLACGLLDRGVTPGERIGIALPTSIDFVRAFFGASAAGAVPVPVPPPFRFASLKSHTQRISAAMRQSRVTKIVSNQAMGDLLEPTLGGDGGFTFLGVQDIRAASPFYATVAADRPALVQYTSGTVESPKGVVLSHANLLSNVRAIIGALGCTSDDVACSWLPLFHDMGLIGALLTAALSDIEICMMPPEDFVRDPGRWLRMISNHRGTVTTAPNSGYLYTLQKMGAEEVRRLDLSSWRLALTGAEAVDVDVLRRFSAHFAAAGFRENAFLPVYGLAEASLAVTFPPTGRPVKSTRVRRDRLGVREVVFTSERDQTTREVASVGTPVADMAVRLVADDGTVLAEEAEVGEIQIRGDSVTGGYEHNPRATAELVHEDGWVSTGDLGFLHDGELFIAGRKKEMVIVFGQNYYASDIESIATAEGGASVQGVLAASVEFDDGEGLVLFVETTEHEPASRDAILAQIRLAVSAALGVAPREVVRVRRGKLPRTSSGKLQRSGVQDLYRELAAGAMAGSAA